MIIPEGSERQPTILHRSLVRHKVTHLVAVPTLMEMLLPHIEGDISFQNSWSRLLKALAYSTALSAPFQTLMCIGAPDKLSLRLLISSGAPLRLGFLRRLAAALQKCRILNLYGCTEAAGDSTWLDASRFLELQTAEGTKAG